MAKEIDNRVVQFEFDNSKFDPNVKRSISAIDKLKSSLNFDKTVKKLNELEKASNFSLDGLTKSLDIVANRFSTIGIIGMTTIQNLTDSAINAGKRIVKALTTDPLKTGFAEYETKMDAITTILTNTADKGSTMEDVTKVLDDLNRYADLTIYNFAEMTRNIGTFTAAGVSLEDSAIAIKGIANLAAGVGSTSRQAATAMYQLSQALAAGSVKLQDWNSVVNAGMGGQLFQNALRQTAKEMGIAVDTSKTFRESLQDGWVTSEVLINTLKKFAQDETLLKAATQVKTFTQLIDTMKESMQSGWAQSWEYIIGNKDEATALFTAISDGFNAVIGKSADARNEMLKFWKENKGREYIIKGIANTLIFLGEVIQPIKDALNDIFPPLTGERLLEFSKQFSELTEKFKISITTSENLNRTFKGIFAALDIGRKFIFAAGNALSEIIKYFIPAGKGLLSLTAKIGDFIVELNKSISDLDVFNKAFQKLGNVLNPIADGIKNAITIIINSFKSLSSIDTSGIDSLSERIQVRFKPIVKILESVGNFFKSIFDKIIKILKNIYPALIKVFNFIGSIFNKISETISKFFENPSFDNLLDIINTGTFATLVLSLRKFAKSLENITVSFKVFGDDDGPLKNLVGILEDVRGCLKAYQADLKANVLLKIAGAIGILAASLMVLSLVDSNKLTIALAGITGLFFNLSAAMAVFSKKINMNNGFFKKRAIATMMITMSTSILILSTAMKNISKLSWDEITKGIASIGALAGILALTARLLSSTQGKIIKGTTSFLFISTSLVILAKAVKSIGELDTTQILKGVAGIGALMTILSVFTNFTSKNKMSITSATGLLIISAAISVLYRSIRNFGEMNQNEIKIGLKTLGLVLAELAIFTKITNSSKGIITTSIGLMILSGAMLIFYNALKKMGGMTWEEIGKGLLTLAGSLTILATALYFISSSVAIKSMGLLLIATSLVILAGALKLMSGMTWEEIGKGLLILAGAMSIISFSMLALKSAIPAVVSLVLISTSLMILAGALRILSSISWSDIGKSILQLAGIFTVIGLTAFVLGPLVPIILALSGAITLLGVGLLAVGAGIALFSTGLTALAVAVTTSHAAILTIFKETIEMIPEVLKTLGKGLVEFVKIFVGGLAKAMPEIIESVEKILIAILKLIRNIAPDLAETILHLILVIIETLEKYTPLILKALLNLGKAILKIIFTWIYDLGVKAGEKLGEAFDNIWDGAKNSIDKLKQKMVDAGKNLIEGFLNGLKSIPVVGDVIQIGESVLTTLKGVFDIHSPSREGYKLGEYVAKGLGNGIRENGTYPSSMAGDVGFKTVKSLAENIEKNSDMPVDAAKKVIDKVTKQFTSAPFSAGAAGRGLTSEYAKALETVKKSEDGNIFTLSESLKVIDNTTKQLTSAPFSAGAAGRGLTSEYAKALETVKKSEDGNIFTSLGKFLYGITEEKDNVKKTSDSLSSLTGNLDSFSSSADKATKSKNQLDEAFQRSCDWIEEEKYYDRLSLEDELAAWEKVANRYAKGTEERKRADREIYRLQKELAAKEKQLQRDSFNHSVNWINEKKQANELSLKEELDAWRRVQSRYAKGTEERINAEKEIYRVKKEINERLKALDENYYQTQKEIIEQLQNDIIELNERYNYEVESRAKEIYNSYRLFDKVQEENEKVSGDELFSNLQSQIIALQDWRDELDKLEQKGVAKGLIEELQEMGPSAASKIKALNTLSESRLEAYVNMWVAKHNLAHNQAVYELDGLRLDTDKQIAKLQENSKTELEELKKIWVEETEELRNLVANEFVSLTTAIKNTVEGLDWKSIGKNLLMSLAGGIFSGISIVKFAISKALEIEFDDIDKAPVITPVLDLSNIEEGKKKLNFMANQGYLLGSIVSGSLKNNRNDTSATNNTNNVENTVIINNTYNVRNEQDIDAISKDMNKLINKHFNAKGVFIP